MWAPLLSSSCFSILHQSLTLFNTLEKGTNHPLLDLKSRTGLVFFFFFFLIKLTTQVVTASGCSTQISVEEKNRISAKNHKKEYPYPNIERSLFLPFSPSHPYHLPGLQESPRIKEVLLAALTHRRQSFNTSNALIDCPTHFLRLRCSIPNLYPHSIYVVLFLKKISSSQLIISGISLINVSILSLYPTLAPTHTHTFPSYQLKECCPHCLLPHTLSILGICQTSLGSS